MTLSIQPAGAGDLQTVLALNEAALPHVNSIGLSQLQALASMACFFSIARIDSEIAGFLLAMREGVCYASENYQWFSRRYPSFVYIDRIVVAHEFFRRSVGRCLYQHLIDASADAPRLTCEVNLRPPNQGSIDFHRRLGFIEVGRQQTENGGKQVALMCKSLTG